ncbi:MAG: alpha/beta hydrolase [Myxococcales bacterium]|nr:alpha/beta hydrolase [Myxococcales bacterium]MCB9531325.1 alpha/beta hydrolase [Myxococcales bacterium]
MSALDMSAPTPVFFGPEDSRLYGVVRRGSARPALGVVVCPPPGDEYPASLRGLRLLEQRLADRGLATLRFDWFGTGDSAGAGDEQRLERWVADVGHAVAHARRALACDAVALVGVRLGGSVGALAAAELTLDLAAAAFWDPVVVGRDYLARKRGDQRAWRADEVIERPESKPFFGPNELLGYDLPPELDRAIGRLDLGAIHTAPAKRVLLVRHDGTPKEGGWWETVTRSGVDAQRVNVDERPPWQTDAGFDAAPVPTQTLATLVRWLAPEAP